MARATKASKTVAGGSAADTEVVSQTTPVTATQVAEPAPVVAAPVAETAPVAAEPVVGGKKPLNEYQSFINAKVAELKVIESNKDKKYMELRAVANTEWKVLHPKEETVASSGDKPKRQYKPREKKEKAPKASATEGAKEKPKKEPKVKREPSAYNLFIKGALAEIKAELASKPDAAKPDQKEIMKLAALKWNEHKATASKA